MPNRMRPTAVALAALSACVFIAASAMPVAAEDARKLLETAMKRYEARVASIESVTIVQEVMGVESSTRLRKVMIEDRPTLVSGSAGRGGDLGSMYKHFDHMAQNATLEGSETVDGHPCWIIQMKDLGGMHVGAEGAGDFESKDGTMYLDKDALVMRRMLMNGMAMRNGVKQPLSIEVHAQDYREIDGWLHPFLTEVNVSGAGGGMAPEMTEMRKAMAQMQEELEKLPPEQRKQMEQMMKGRIPQFEEGSDGDALKVTVKVKELRVNEAAE